MEATLGMHYGRCGHQFVPMALKRLHLVCYLDILFLRREDPGHVISADGDIDNRIVELRRCAAMNVEIRDVVHKWHGP